MRSWICGVLICLSYPASAQDYFYDGYYFEPGVLVEAGIRTGFLNSLTDVGKKPSKSNYFNEFSWPSIRPSVGLDIGLVFQRSFSLRLSLTRGMVNGADSAINSGKAEVSPRRSRNLHFKSPITELGLKTEIHPLGLLGNSSRASPYLLAGAGLVFYNPKAFLNGHWADLRDLRTEGQGIIPGVWNYGRSAFSLSAGAGIYIDISAGWSMRVEWDHRFLFTDYLDDISTNFIDPAIVKGQLDVSQLENLQRLYNLSGDYNGSSISRPGMVRGNPRKKDAIAGLSVNFSKVLNRRRI